LNPFLDRKANKSTNEEVVHPFMVVENYLMDRLEFLDEKTRSNSKLTKLTIDRSEAFFSVILILIGLDKEKMV
jgi:hypothetical protein